MLDLQALNPPQYQAACHRAGPLVVFAGAGSGKTRVITYRIARLVSEARVPPWRILAVTFTNKAAREMQERLRSLLAAGADGLWVGTFHAVCARLLRAHADACGVRRSFVIYDDADQKAMLTRVLRDMGLDERRYAPKLVGSRINAAKQEGLDPEAYVRRDYLDEVIQRIYARYEQQMAAAGALDFGDLIYRLVRAMKADPQLREQVQARFDHVLVDEFQDTNKVQLELVSLLCEQHTNLCVVGDDDQSIYRWRGADRRNILDFQRQFPGATVVKLEQNYRSTARILRVANAVIARNLEREPKRLWTEKDDGRAISVTACDDERMEAETLVRAVRELLADGYGLADIAVLYRKHAQSRVLEEAFRAANLPYRVIGGTRFYDRAEVKDVLAYLRVVHNPDDDISLLRIVNTPARGIGKTTIQRVLDAAAEAGASVWDTLARLASEDGGALGAATRKKLGTFVSFVEGLRKDAQAGHGPSDLADRVLVDTGYLQQLRDADNAEADARLDNLRELVGSMKEFEQEAEEATLSTFLELVTLQTDADRVEQDQSLTMMTVHAAKGLEFPIVMVTGLEEEMFPHGLGPEEDPDQLEEERRLAYVAFTRAEERLLLSHAHARRIYGQLKIRRRSRFIDEMPAEDLELLGRQSGLPMGGWAVQAPFYAGGASSPNRSPQRGMPTWSRGYPPAEAPPSVPTGDSYVDASEMSDLGDDAVPRAGMRVRHAKFGVGQVVDVSASPSLLVRFPGWGTKRIRATYLEPA